MKNVFKKFLYLPFYILAFFIVLIIRVISPWFLVRFEVMTSDRLGHFAANTELYLCERKANLNRPTLHHIDIFYTLRNSICNHTLLQMWKRVIRIWPTWIMSPIARVNRLIPGGKLHEIGHNTQSDRDVHNLLDQYPQHLHFSAAEELVGQAKLLAMGILPNSLFVCLIVRDSAYLSEHSNGNITDNHNYRDSDVDNYALAARALTERGYFVLRMGAKVHSKMNIAEPKVIDYATNGMRNDFMDIYLGAKCHFCISVGTGFDAVPIIFRRPIVYVNMAPIGYLFTFSNKFIGICKHYFAGDRNREMSLSDIFTCGAGFLLRASDYEFQDIQLYENTPEEIRDVVIEMEERLAGCWQPQPDDVILQQQFWKIFSHWAVEPFASKRIHGALRSRFGSAFLRNNRRFLD